ncbi:uncharacterized protein LOC102069031 isoform X2 [Zonotrichia albicollis]|uniref:uncharacterized protein LOC102069031 isoform X2 n=1 Tax=Zonotrichia albicollis TaxID=44394 RepID=UPI003D81106C
MMGAVVPEVAPALGLGVREGTWRTLLRPSPDFRSSAEPVGEGDLDSQTTTTTEPLGDGEDVSAGRTFPVPVMLPIQKPGSGRRGPPRGKNKATGQKKPHEPSEHMREMLKEMQQAGQEADGEAVQKKAFPGGSGGSLTAASAGREAMPGTVTGDEVAAKASPLDWLNKVLKPLEPPSDVSAGRTFPAPLLIPTEKPGSNRWGPLRGKNKTPGHKKPHELNNILERMVTELPKGNGAPVHL